jgi:hypothetical protein
MNLLKISDKIILPIYVVFLAIGLTLLISNYFFSYTPLNTLLVIIIISYPTYRFLYSRLNIGLKVLAGLLLLVVAIWLGYKIAFVRAFADSTLENKNEWNFPKYKIFLNRKQGWAGAPYLQYDLRRYRFFRLVNKNIAVGYPNFDEPTSCQIVFKEDPYSEIPLYKFDRCKITLERIEKSGR